MALFPFIGTVFGEETVSLYRDTTGQTWGSDGRPVALTRTLVTASMLASIQPLSGRDWQLADLGGRQQDYVKVYSETEMRSGDDKATPAVRCDRLVQADGRTYEVVTVLPYRNGPYPHWKAIARRVDEAAA